MMCYANSINNKRYIYLFGLYIRGTISPPPPSSPFPFPLIQATGECISGVKEIAVYQNFLFSSVVR